MTSKTPVGDLRGREWRRFLHAPDGALVEELYNPALAESIAYDRCCAYFSSSALAVAARGFGKLVERLDSLLIPPTLSVRLLVNEQLSREDVRALTEEGDYSVLERALKERLKTPQEALEKERLAMLGLMVQRGWLEVRVGIMRRGTGILHAKYGIVRDESNNALVFRGSANESAQALRENYEEVEVSTSWHDAEAVSYYSKRFNDLWDGRAADVQTYALPDAIRHELIRFANEAELVSIQRHRRASRLERQKTAMLWQFICEAPYLKNGTSACDATAMVDLWPHQGRVVEEASTAWPDGRLLCDEVGMGKTVEAILLLRRLMAGRGVKRTLILLPAGLLRQWQGELREKGGMIFPRLQGADTLVWPDGKEVRVEGFAEALKQDVLLVSREMARLEDNLAVILQAEPWDLVLLDESHAARRRESKEGEFNRGNLLLNLLREMQLQRRTRGFLLLSATPMQTQPWEPWDLLSVLGEGGAWLAEFRAVRDYYSAMAMTRRGLCSLEDTRPAASLILNDQRFPEPPEGFVLPEDFERLAQKLVFVPPGERDQIANWMRSGSPLTLRMHRNTRNTLREYYHLGLLDKPPAVRLVRDVVFNYGSKQERGIYDSLTRYIERRFEELERETPGKGFVMTIYRRRVASSPYAIEQSLVRRCDGLRRVLARHAYDSSITPEDFPEDLRSEDLGDGSDHERKSAAFPTDPVLAKREYDDVEELLRNLADLRGTDTKRDKFLSTLRGVSQDGRAVLVFTEYTDTLTYLRDYLVISYGETLGCYSGDGGKIYDGQKWKTVTKDVITEALRSGQLRILLCSDAASEGLNLQAAGAIINYDLPWNPSKVEQRIGRVDRIGQKLPSIPVINFFLEHSVDQRVYEVLRERCGMFQHFVGAMQPVLARAQTMLLGREPVDTETLRKLAVQEEQDAVISQTYVESRAEPMAIAKPVLTRDDLLDGLRRLPSALDTVEYGMSLGVVDLRGIGDTPLRFGTTLKTLEADDALLPLSPLTAACRTISDALQAPGETLPLVVGISSCGAFRTSVAVWTTDAERVIVDSMQALAALVDSWDGQSPSSENWLAALDAAKAEANREVERLEKLAKEKERQMVEAQRAAARRRLMLELGRYLVCVRDGTDDLNGTFYEQMSRDLSSAGRLRFCFERLGEQYPEWTTDLLAGLERFKDELTNNRRLGRLLGGEIDAALADPRWKQV